MVKIKYSNDYGKFRLLNGNRSISKNKVAQLIESIKQIGWITNPINVNEKMEIIDGQHRFEALKELKMPIEYTISDGLGLKETRLMNSTSKNWATTDYVESYANDGDLNYINLQILRKKYSRLNLSTIVTVVTNSIYTSGGRSTFLRKGNLNLPTSLLNELFPIFDYVMEHYDDITRIEGNSLAIVGCICWVLRNTNVNRKRFADILHKSIFNPVSDKVPIRFLENLSTEYNKRLSKEKQIKFHTLFELAGK